MVVLSKVKEANLQATSVLPSGLVAVFAGATAGIGEMTMKAFAKHTVRPKIHFIGRAQAAGDRLLQELKALNPEGEYEFIKADMSLLKNVDEVCKNIKSKEKTINVLFMTQGTLKYSASTEEGLALIPALTLYSRTRLTVNLLPLIQQATSVRRVVTVMAGGKEGAISPGDIEGKNLSFINSRGHLSSVITLSLEKLTQMAPNVSFVHNFPGLVDTDIIRTGDGMVMSTLKSGYRFSMAAMHKFVPPEEVGERHTFFCLSGRYPPKAPSDSLQGVPSDVIGTGADGKSGGGFYSVDWNGESASAKVVKLLDKYRAEGMVDQVWAHIEGEFKRITGTASI